MSTPLVGGGRRPPTVLLVSPRPPRADGQGDQRRAHEILAALSAEWDVDVVSWLPDVNRSGLRRWVANPVQLARALALSAVMPAQVAYVQSRAPRSLPATAAAYDAVVFVTDRAVPRRVPEGAVVDFVDDLGGIALRRARSSRRWRALFWRWEGSRLRRHDRRLLERVRVAVAHSSPDATGIGATVETIPLSIGTEPMPDEGDRIVFLGNLFYAPNHEAATWICDELAPELGRRGIPPGTVLVAGRRPQPSLCERATATGVELRADVPDLAAVLAEAAVVIAPMRLGTGAQYKVLDAVGAGRACVVSPVANAGLDLADEVSALVTEREAKPCADAIVRLLEDPALRRRLAAAARARLAGYLPEAVAESWRRTVRTVVDGRRG
ncbi:MAG TPA: glycosyltransferase [Acidimicrobiales bacterium]|nr:glycosyltransferase [Acidimicrobiales bacterium]